MPADSPSSGARRADEKPFGRYTLLRKLATGGMGEVFLARLSGDGGFEKLLVIKKMRPELASDAEFVSRFQDEAHVLVQLQHPAIAQVYDMGEAEGGPFMALEFVDGKDLKAVLARCQERSARVPTAIALHVMIRVLDALAYAHRKRDDAGRELNLVHRDISPPNVLLTYDGEVKVIDFGLAKTATSVQRTQAGALVGKFSYMAPEAARHQALDRRADLFAAGVVLHEMLNGRHVLEGLGAGEVMMRVVKPAFPRLHGAVPGVSVALDAAMQRALSPEPAQRFSTAEEMRDVLATALAALQPGLGPEVVARFMQSLFAAEYAEERALLQALHQAPGGAAAWAPARSIDPTLQTFRASTPALSPFAPREPETFDSGEYRPDEQDEDPSMAATVFAGPGSARPDTVPSPAARTPVAAPAFGVADTMLSMKPVALERPRVTSGSRPRPQPAPAGIPMLLTQVREPERPMELPTAPEVSAAGDGQATVEARLDELPGLSVPMPAAGSRPPVRPAKRGIAIYVIAALLLAAALVLAGVAVKHRRSAQRAGDLGQTFGHRPAQRGKLQRRPTQRQVQLARASR